MAAGVATVALGGGWIVVELVGVTPGLETFTGWPGLVAEGWRDMTATTGSALLELLPGGATGSGDAITGWSPPLREDLVGTLLSALMAGAASLMLHLAATES